jgi:hypothetical protein
MRAVPFLMVVASVGLVLLRGCSVDDSARTRSRRIPTYTWGEMHDIFTLENELEERLRRLQMFREVLQDTEQALLRQALALDAATEAVTEAARQNNPSFLQNLEQRYGGMPVREQVALTLVLRLTLAQHMGSLSTEQSLVVERVRRELASRPGAAATLREQLETPIH